jgi:hypothetical protein
MSSYASSGHRRDSNYSLATGPLRGMTIGGLSPCLHSPDLSCDLKAAPAAARSRQHMDYWLCG